MVMQSFPMQLMSSQYICLVLEKKIQSDFKKNI